MQEESGEIMIGLKVYWSQLNMYFTGDGAVKDEDGYFMVLGGI